MIPTILNLPPLAFQDPLFTTCGVAHIRMLIGIIIRVALATLVVDLVKVL
jgi:hypothetical protein